MGLLNEESCRVLFGEYVKNGRKARKMNQTELADKLGITQPYISFIERGEREIDLVLAFKICDVLQLDIRDFITKHL